MNEKLFSDVQNLLMSLEGMNYRDAKILLETALKVLESNCYLQLNSKEIAEGLKNGEYQHRITTD